VVRLEFTPVQMGLPMFGWTVLDAKSAEQPHHVRELALVPGHVNVNRWGVSPLRLSCAPLGYPA